MALSKIFNPRHWFGSKPTYTYDPHAPEMRRSPEENPQTAHAQPPQQKRGWGLPTPSWAAYRRNRQIAKARARGEQPPFFESEGGLHD